jgi:Ca-activated chloride channel homolog
MCDSSRLPLNNRRASDRVRPDRSSADKGVRAYTEHCLQKLFVAVFVTAFCALGWGGASAQPAATFKSSVDVVPISVAVHDSRGRMITTLRADDFEVRDKGERRPILTFQSDDASPITLAVVVDVSGSMRLSSKLRIAREVVKRLASNLEDGRDEVGLFTFDAALHEEQPFTSHPASLDEALSHAEPGGVTSLYDAIAETAHRLAERPAPRRAIVVVTDGIDTSSTLTSPEVSALASAIDAPVYVVATGPRIDHAVFAERTTNRSASKSADLQDLAVWTGGDLLWVNSPDEAAVRAFQILTELRHQYLIAIDSSAEGDWRPIDVRVRDRHLTVRARSGYFSRH